MKKCRKCVALLLAVAMMVSMNGIAVMASTILPDEEKNTNNSKDTLASTATNYDNFEQETASSTMSYSDLVSNYSYSFDSESHIVTLVTYIGTAAEITIPATAVIDTNGTTYGVQITNGTFQENHTITSVNIEPGVLILDNIFRNAFYNCQALLNVQGIPESVTDIRNCFGCCESLTSAPAIPESAIDMGFCFYRCSNLTSAPAIPANVIDMEACFKECSKLTSAPTIPGGVTDMSACFMGCSSLTSAPTIPGGVTDMVGCFRECSSLTSAPTIPGGVTDMSACFLGCQKLISAPTIPAGVTNMGFCFEGCSSLTSAPTIPADVTVMAGCFRGCYKLTSAPTIPDKVTDIGFCFVNCQSLTSAPQIPESVKDMTYLFNGCTALQGSMTIRANPEFFDKCFESAATNGTGLVVNYTSNCTNIDSIIATKSPESRITKGNAIDVTYDEPGESYAIHFNTQGGSLLPSQEIKVGGKVKLPQSPVKAGYTFAGWYKEAACQNAWNFDTDTVTAGFTLYAKWAAISVSNIRLNSSNLSLAKGNIATLKATVTPDNSLNKDVSWQSSNENVATIDSNGKIVAKNYGSAMITATAKDHSGVSATCRINVGYSIKYKLNGGKNNSSNPSSYYNVKVTLKDPTRKGYLFKGWYIDKKYKNKITSIQKGTKKNYTLYAKWEKVRVSKADISKLSNTKMQQLTIQLKKVNGAEGYEIVYAENDKLSKNKKIITSKGTSKTIKKLKKGNTYYVKVRAYKIDSTNNKVYGSYSPTKKIKLK